MGTRWVSRNLGMFTGADQTQNFRALASIFPCRVVRRSPEPLSLPVGRPVQLPSTYAFEGRTRSSQELLEGTETAGLMVLQRGARVYENYWLGVTASTQWALFSITKSWLSALIGIALQEGAIASLDVQVTQYVPSLERTAYDGATLKHVLQMSSGARWDEASAHADSDIREAGRALAAGGARSDVAHALKRELQPGSYHRYSSIDTHVLSLVLRRATRCAPSEYLQTKLWAPLGAEHDAFWIVEGDGREWAGAGLNATLGDVARLGLLYAQHGLWQGQRLLPTEWVRTSVTPDAPHLQPGLREGSASPFGYGYQWWKPDQSASYCAMGIYNQFVWVDPERELVIVKLSANRRYASTPDSEHFGEVEHFAFFRALAAHCA